MRQIRYHDLRHSCASLLLANGVPMKQIQEWLGHSDFSTTANIYAHLDSRRNAQWLGLCSELKRKASSRKSRLLARFLAERVGFEPTEPCGSTDFECCKTMADSPPEQVVSGRFVRSRRPRRCKGFRTFRPVSAGGDLKCPRVQIKLRSCVKSRRSCAFARSQARKQRPRQHR